MEKLIRLEAVAVFLGLGVHTVRENVVHKPMKIKIGDQHYNVRGVPFSRVQALRPDAREDWLSAPFQCLAEQQAQISGLSASLLDERARLALALDAEERAVTEATRLRKGNERLTMAVVLLLSLSLGLGLL